MADDDVATSVSVASLDPTEPARVIDTVGANEEPEYQPPLPPEFDLEINSLPTADTHARHAARRHKCKMEKRIKRILNRALVGEKVFDEGATLDLTHYLLRTIILGRLSLHTIAVRILGTTRNILFGTTAVPPATSITFEARSDGFTTDPYAVRFRFWFDNEIWAVHATDVLAEERMATALV